MSNEMLSQEEIDALMKGNVILEDESENKNILNEMEIDAIGEIGNISMGTAATTLFTLLGNKVQITTPNVKQTTIKEIAQSYPIPFIAVQVNYRIGIEGMNLLILREDDVKIITSLMLGGDGKTDIPEELNEIHLSAISEAMNQMIGSSSTSLSEMIGEKIDITPPNVMKVDLAGNNIDPAILSADEQIICISFRMTVGDLIDSTIMQILPIDFAKGLVDKMLYGKGSASVSAEPPPAERIASSVQYKEEEYDIKEITSKDEYSSDRTHHNQQDDYDYDYYEEPVKRNERPVNVKSASFTSFDEPVRRPVKVPENIDLIKDVLLKVTVELGKTSKPIDEILQFSPGSILELDRLAGEPLDIMVNGKKIAIGEVVVIDENYGIRITDIVKAEKRLRNI